MVHISSEVGMNAAFASLSRAAVVLLALVLRLTPRTEPRPKGFAGRF